MKIVEINALSNGAHRNQNGFTGSVPEGWAVIPDELETSNFPFGKIEIDENGVIRLPETIAVQLYCFDYKTSVLKNEFTLLKGEINGGSVLIPKEAFNKHGLFAEDQRITQERDMWARLISEYKFINIPYDTAMIRTHSNQVSNTNPNVKIESDKKNIEIIKNISEERIKKMSMSKTTFYEILRAHYENNNNKAVASAITKLLNESIEK